MLQLRIAVVFGLSLFALAAEAKGGGSHGSTTGQMDAVRGYTRADGTYVASYERAAPGTAIHNADGSTSMSSSSNDGSFSAAELTSATKQSVKSAPVCEFKAVMTDDEIAAGKPL